MYTVAARVSPHVYVCFSTDTIKQRQSSTQAADDAIKDKCHHAPDGIYL